jgi:hypothetical protein
LWSLVHLRLDLAVQAIDGMLKLRIEREQSLSLRGGMSSQGQSPKLVLASTSSPVCPPNALTGESQRQYFPGKFNKNKGASSTPKCASVYANLWQRTTRTFPRTTVHRLTDRHDEAFYAVGKA